MDIGSNIRMARIHAGFTQEQAAETLGVSRQTISNWENNKTLPDVALARSISEAYGVSVDQLINHQTVELHDSVSEAEPLSEYRFDRKIALTIAFGYLACWMICVMLFWVGGSSGAFAFFYVLVILRIIFPTATFVCSVLIGFLHCLPAYRFFMIFGFGFMHMLLPYSTYTFVSMIKNGCVSFPDLDSFFMGLCLSAFGILFGWIIRWAAVLITKLVNRGFF